MSHRRDYYNKLAAFALPLRTVVFLDSDMIVLKNIDDLFGALGDNYILAGVQVLFSFIIPSFNQTDLFPFHSR